MIRQEIGPVMSVRVSRAWDGDVELAVERTDGKPAPGSGFTVSFDAESWTKFRAAVLEFDPQRLEPGRLAL